jgi:hypothetical protein
MEEFLISTRVALFRLGWLYFGFFLQLNFSICAKKEEEMSHAGLMYHTINLDHNNEDILVVHCWVLYVNLIHYH